MHDDEVQTIYAATQPTETDLRPDARLREPHVALPGRWQP